MLTTNTMLYHSVTLETEPLTKKQNLSECRICGAPAQYVNFGAISCHSCKMFFKRNANIGQKAFKCNFGGNCEIKRDNHHMCASCRLKRCFQYGMTTDKFRTSRPKKSKTKSLVKVEPRYQSEKFSIINSLKPDHSLLTTSQWTLPGVSRGPKHWGAVDEFCEIF
ncbi:unnamed protein product [Adineta steineri]|uniref:Nuclear receptor domain-containing protein n=1 Tax=Adineta steineri TaxID=433720 RepID=A0A814CGJ5_9BILA|nr:unnamed protein product [Adineta steineri]